MELKDIVGYLPYGLKIQAGEDIYDVIAIGKNILYFKGGLLIIEDSYTKPILRPLSDLTKEIEVNGEKFVPLDLICEKYPVDIDEKGICSNSTDEFGILHLPYSIIRKLYEWHFDIHGLIEKGEAIDINQLK